MSATPLHSVWSKSSAAGLVCAANIRPEPILWLWDGWLAAGKLHILAGAPGTGKTTIALAMAATLTTGKRWPDGSESTPGEVFIWSSEDDPKDTLVPRLHAMGADVSRIHFITTVGDGEHLRAFDPASDMLQLEAAIRQTGKHPRLLIVDPIVSAVAGDSHKNGETRRALQPLVDLGVAHNCAVLGISHFSKGSGGREVTERVTGSLAFGALARVVMAAAKTSEDQGGKRMLVRAKSNIGADSGGYYYDLQQVDVPKFPGVSASCLLWGDAIEGSAREILAQAEQVMGDEEKSALDEAADWLTDLLAMGPVAQTEIRLQAHQIGHAWKTVRNAKTKIGVMSNKTGLKDGWVWALPEDAQENLKMPTENHWAPSKDDGHLREEGEL